MGIGAQPSDHFLAAEFGHGKGVGPSRLHHLNQAFAFRHRLGVAIGAIRIGQGFGPDTENDLPAGMSLELFTSLGDRKPDRIAMGAGKRNRKAGRVFFQRTCQKVHGW